MKIFLYTGLILILSACSPLFVIRAAYEQGRILAVREPIEETLRDTALSEDFKQKLRLVLKAKEFSALTGLEPDDSFSSFSQLEHDAAAWVISASKKDSFQPFTWWFPIVGSVPYKGYFSKEDAFEAASELNQEGWETWIRPTAAFSTLGWFDDPLLSSTLSLPAVDVVNTVIHETVHATVWIPGSVSFNESLANYIAFRASINFYNWAGQQDFAGLPRPYLESLGQQSVADFTRELAFADGMDSLWARLEELYNSDESVERKLIMRQEIFEQVAGEFRAVNPGIDFLKQLNNAEIMQRRLYLRRLRDFDNAFKKTGYNWNRYIAEIKAFRQIAKEGEEENFGLFFNLHG